MTETEYRNVVYVVCVCVCVFYVITLQNNQPYSKFYVCPRIDNYTKADRIAIQHVLQSCHGHVQGVNPTLVS